MRFTGDLRKPLIDCDTMRPLIIFSPNEDFSQAYEELKDCKNLSLEIKKYRRKRSLDANAYYWVLIGKLAKVLHLSNPELHNMMLCKYGQPELFDGKTVYTTIPDTESSEKKVANAMDYHLKPTSQVREGNDGVMYRTYKLLRGSSTYNSEEMARLINGLIGCCKDAGIPDAEIATPDEKRLLKERYGVDIG